ncbi:hypothetical protein POVCU1_001120 [Plasmodium ovale curtisi]|uniref:Uncharacterized protein n=1 Tax=Plasmodium ovale curtisi TaxID=864141 RepID=A0A1A8VJ16_PLAOA|nr:hypothetical protein POVCU1_001120 [Plasmodium ovale curtisi]
MRTGDFISLRREIHKTVATSLAPNWRCKRILQLSCSVLPTMNGGVMFSGLGAAQKVQVGNSQNLSLKTEQMVRCKTAKPQSRETANPENRRT